MDEFYNDTNPNMQQAILNYKNYVADAIDPKDLYVAPKSLNVIEVNSFETWHQMLRSIEKLDFTYFIEV
jgi:hypothetical protein